MTLDMLKIGNRGKITKVGGEGALRLRFLDMGLIPHTEVKMQKTAPSGDPIQILIRGYELTLRLEEASKIEIEEKLNEYFGIRFTDLPALTDKDQHELDPAVLGYLLVSVGKPKPYSYAIRDTRDVSAIPGL